MSQQNFLKGSIMKCHFCFEPLMADKPANKIMPPGFDIPLLIFCHRDECLEKAEAHVDELNKELE